MPSSNRPFAIALTDAQWALASHQQTRLAPRGVELALAEPAGPSAVAVETDTLAGLAFDSRCRLYHARPEEGRVEKWLWAAAGDRPGSAAPTELEAAALIPRPYLGQEAREGAGAGQFSPRPPPPPELSRPTALGVDADDRLFVLCAGSAEVVVLDLQAERVLGRARFFAPDGRRAEPVDLAVSGRDVWVLTRNPSALFWMSARSEPRALTLAAPLPASGGFRPPGAPPIAALPAAPMLGFDPPLGEVLRVAALSRRMIAVLERVPGGARVRFPRVLFGEPVAAMDLDGSIDGGFGGASDLALYEETAADGSRRVALVLARARDDAGTGPVEAGFARFLRSSSGEMPWLWDRGWRALGYDGRGIVLTPDPRRPIGYWTTKDRFGAPLPDRPKYVQRGGVVTQGFDAGAFQTRWGRLFLDACIPEGTEVRVYCATRDEPPEPDDAGAGPTPAHDPLDALPRNPPANATPAPLTPAILKLAPMPLRSLFDPPPPTLPVHRRETGRELPWAPIPPEDGFRTYEAAIHAPPGRWLWVRLELIGDSRSTPTVRALRAEYPGHDLLARLPATLSREPRAAEFLLYFLAMFEGALKELESRAAAREILVSPYAAPKELLPWLAGFVGLLLDQRWSEKAKRRFVAEAAALFRFRGTKASLETMLEIALGVRPVLLERYRLRESGGALVGGGSAAFTSSVLGGGFCIGGPVGVQGERPLVGTLEQALDRAAHRFTVIVPRPLSAEERDIAAFILDHHRPAHTAYDLCSIDAGIRVGLGLHVGLSSLVGSSGGFTPSVLGAASLGRGSILGSPLPGMLLGTAALQLGSRTG